MTEPAEISVATEPGPGQATADHPASASPIPDTAPEPTLSKSAQKKAAKAERYAVLKLERRAREKVAKKEKQRVKAEKRAAGELDGEDEDEQNRRKKKARVGGSCQFRGRVVVDLGFDEMMNDKEIVSLCSQLAYTYSANRQASYPFSLVFSSLNGRTFTRLESMSDASYKRWAKTEWWREGYDRLWLGQSGSSITIQHASASTESASLSRDQPDMVQDASDTHSDLLPGAGGHSPPNDAQQRVVYLTADSEEELSELKEDETYVIGGICDHNRYKNLCLNKAIDSGIRTARLPIGRYLASLPTRKVLTVNQVFEILLKWVETKNWEEALYSVVPKRKFQTGGKGNADSGNVESQSATVPDAVDAAPEAAQSEATVKPVAVGELDQDPEDDGPI